MGAPGALLTASSLSAVNSGGSAPPEMYIELWFYSGSYGTQGSGTPSAGGTQFLARGATSSTTQMALHTLNSSWNPNNKYSFEAAFQVSSSGYTANAALWDVTSNAIVSGSTISSTSTTISVIRSGQFTLAPGHKYTVTVWAGNANIYITDASLIVFPS